MADSTRRLVTLTQHRWELTTPTNATEMSKAISAAVQGWLQLHEGEFTHDDSLSITAEDDNIVIFFNMEDTAS